MFSSSVSLQFQLQVKRKRKADKHASMIRLDVT